MKVRNYEIGDTEQIIKLFYETVHTVNIQDYTRGSTERAKIYQLCHDQKSLTFLLLKLRGII
ncbi:MAG: hypothetical protein ACM65L_08310 [Microcoleus sp.]